MTRALCGLLLLVPFVAHAQSADEIVTRVLDSDTWGLADAEVSARVLVHDQSGSTRELAFSGRSRRYDRPRTKALLRFSAPGDLAGVGFLQIQKKDGDDERFLYLPELKRSRRIAGASRSQAFMGTDFNYADLDRRDLRNSKATIKGEENIGKFLCWRVEAVSQEPDAIYARQELWVRKDNFMPLKATMFNRAGVLLKTLTSQEIKRISGRWYITRSTMQNHQDQRTTEMLLDKVTPRTDIPDDEFTVRNLEKN